MMIHSFLLIGQSNMGGRGFIHEALEIDRDKLKVLKNGRWQKLFRPVNPDRFTSGVNLAESFAEIYAKEFGVTVEAEIYKRIRKCDFKTCGQVALFTDTTFQNFIIINRGFGKNLRVGLEFNICTGFIGFTHNF